MDGSFTPDGERGFGRVLLRDTLPKRGEGATTLFFYDMAVTQAGQMTEYMVTVRPHDARTTLWSQETLQTFRVYCFLVASFLPAPSITQRINR